jgi:hypothetical protein
MKSYDVLKSETVNLAVEVKPDDFFIFGKLTYNIQKDGRHVYVIDIEPDKFDKALELSGDEMFPGFDPGNGWVQRHDKEISFIYERTYNPKRCDLAEVLKPWGMTPETYTKWDLLKKTKGIHIRDKWRVISPN